jgi:hypothetical protein
MLFERLQVGAETFEPTGRQWKPVEELDDGAPAEQRHELALLDKPSTSGRRWYAAVDEIIGVQCKIVFAEWPTLDRAGRLVFDGATGSRWYAVAQVRAVVDGFRELHRALRIGDVFAIDSPQPGLALSRWSRVVVVPGPARRAAKIAASAARTGPAAARPEGAAAAPAPTRRATPSRAERTIPSSVAGPVI